MHSIPLNFGVARHCNDLFPRYWLWCLPGLRNRSRDGDDVIMTSPVERQWSLWWGVSFEIIVLPWTVSKIFTLTSFRPKKPVTWLRWRHSDITSRKTMVTLVGVSFELIVLQWAVSEIFVLTSTKFEKADTLPGWCHHYVFRVRNAGHMTTIASSRRHQLKA